MAYREDNNENPEMIDFTEISKKWEELCSYTEEGLMSLTENILKETGMEK